MISIKHINLLGDIERKVQDLETYSASKQKRIQELFAHGLVNLNEDEVTLTEKAIALVKSIEIHVASVIHKV